jgi:ferredoxin
MVDEAHEITVNEKAFNRLSRARREGETLSDVIVRLSAATLEGLQRRGEMEMVTSDGRKLTISVDQSKCLGAMSCVTMAPAIFAYDVTDTGHWRKRAEPLGMRDADEGEVDSESMTLAAESCPYQAITIRDSATGEILAP